MERLLWKGVVGRIILARHYIHGTRDLRGGNDCLMHNNTSDCGHLPNTFSYEILSTRVTHHQLKHQFIQETYGLHAARLGLLGEVFGLEMVSF